MHNITVDNNCMMCSLGKFAVDNKIPTVFEGGGGWTVAGFINTVACKKTYEQLASTYPILYQSEIRINKNSGRQCFIVLFDVSSAPAGYGFNATDKYYWNH